MFNQWYVIMMSDYNNDEGIFLHIIQVLNGHYWRLIFIMHIKY